MQEKSDRLKNRRNLRERFNNQGLRMTVPRQIILSVLEESETFMSAEDVFAEIQEDYPGIGLATVYRTVNLLSDMGIITRYEFGEGKARYELAELSVDNHHHHIICEKCFKVIKYSDFLDDERKHYCDMESILSEKYGVEIRRHVVQFYGVCKDCNT